MKVVIKDCMTTRLRIRNVALVLIGVAVLLSKKWFSDSTGSLAHAYMGNVAASFAVYFIVALAAVPRLHGIWIAVVALVIVEAFELTNGFGVMTNVYDPFDYLANILGVALAYIVDLASVRILQARSSSS